MSTKIIYADYGNWTDLPLHQILYEWIVKNASMPSDMSTIVAYIGLFLITWFSIVWFTRFIMTIIWPLFLIAMAIVVFRILQFYEPEEITALITKSLTMVADTLFMLLAKALEFGLSFFE